MMRTFCSSPPGRRSLWPLALVLLAAAPPAQAAETLRVATFNASLYGSRSGQVRERIAGGDDRQAAMLAEIIQRVRPDVLLLNEIDYEADGATLRVFCEKYLERDQNNLQLAEGAKAIEYEYRFTAPVNTGVHSGFDLDRNGVVDAKRRGETYAGDCWGFGRYEGQYGMAILSRFPIDEAAVRTFQKFLWRDMPGALLPDDAAKPGEGDWYTPEELAQFRLSSKSHWDVPIVVGERRIHLLASHPTPPVFDGEEDRNGRRNEDEIRFWVDYVAANPPPSKGGLRQAQPSGARGGIQSADSAAIVSSPDSDANPSPNLSPEGRGIENGYIYDDKGRRGGLAGVGDDPARGESFIILGDLNGDPNDGDGQEGISRLLASPGLLKYSPPESAGGVEQARLQGRANAQHRGNPAFDTVDAAERPQPGNLRIDYVLPSADLRVAAAGVFWPEKSAPLFPLVGVDPFPSSDHRLAWVDVELE